MQTKNQITDNEKQNKTVGILTKTNNFKNNNEKEITQNQMNFNTQSGNNNEINNTNEKTRKNDNFLFDGKQDFEEAIVEAFREFDKDHTDFITKEELGNFMKRLGYKVTEIELEEIINEIDEDGNGLIGLKEFRNIITKSINDEFNINTSIEAFGVFDKYKTEKLNSEYLKDILLSPIGDTQFTEEEVNSLVNCLKKDNNGDVNYRDIVKGTFDIFQSEN